MEGRHLEDEVVAQHVRAELVRGEVTDRAAHHVRRVTLAGVDATREDDADARAERVEVLREVGDGEQVAAVAADGRAQVAPPHERLVPRVVLEQPQLALQVRVRVRIRVREVYPP